MIEVRLYLCFDAQLAGHVPLDPFDLISVICVLSVTASPLVRIGQRNERGEEPSWRGRSKTKVVVEDASRGLALAAGAGRGVEAPSRP